MKIVIASLIAALSMFLMVERNDAQGKGKYTTAQVMAKAMKGGLCSKVASGKASDAEKKELVELFEAMAANTPPKGDAASWKEKTGALVAAAKSGDGAALKAAANCAGCHKVHK